MIRTSVTPTRGSAVSTISPARNGVLQRQCACGEHTVGSGECEGCKQKGVELQRRPDRHGTPAMAPPLVHEVLRSPGRPLDPKTRDFMEPRLGQDFSRVRVHTDAKAAESARDVHALAYTVGSDVVFAAEQYAPFRKTGKRLLAHELAHTIQQGGASRGTGIEIGGVDNPHEREADRLADAVMAGDRRQTVSKSAPSMLHRQLAPTDTQQEDETEGESQTDDGEAHDGDTPVNASPAPEVSGGSAIGTEMLGELLAANDAGELQQQEQKGGDTKKTDTKPDPKPKEKPKPKPTITSIDVDLSSQKMTVHYSDNTTETHDVASGRGRPGTTDDPCKTQKEVNCTPTGDFKIGSKGNKDTANQHGDKMAWYVELTGSPDINGRGIGIHNSQSVGGGPRSHGCIRVGSSAADEAFAKKINEGVTGSTDIHVTGKAATKPYGAPPAKKAPKQKTK